MNIYDTANNLAKEIRESKEYLEFAKIKKEIALDTSKKEALEAFEKLRYEIQLQTMQGEKENADKMKLLQEKYMDLVKDEKIKQYFESEMKFNVLIADVNKIIAEAVKDVL